MRWVALYSYTLVEQDEWRRPRRGDWLARLDEVVVDTPGLSNGQRKVRATQGNLLPNGKAFIEKSVGDGKCSRNIPLISFG